MEKKKDIEDRYIIWAKNTIYSHKKRGFSVNLEYDKLAKRASHTTHCIICGRNLNWNSRKVSPSSPTLDRIDNEKELNDSNTQIICYRCNAMKGSMTLQEFIFYCNIIAERARGNGVDILPLQEIEEMRSKAKNYLHKAAGEFAIYYYGIKKFARDPEGYINDVKAISALMRSHDSFQEYLDNHPLISEERTIELGKELIEKGELRLEA